MERHNENGVQNTIIVYHRANSHFRTAYIQLVDKIIKSSKYQTERIIISREISIFHRRELT